MTRRELSPRERIRGRQVARAKQPLDLQTLVRLRSIAAARLERKIVYRRVLRGWRSYGTSYYAKVTDVTSAEWIFALQELLSLISWQNLPAKKVWKPKRGPRYIPPVDHRARKRQLLKKLMQK